METHLLQNNPKWVIYYAFLSFQVHYGTRNSGGGDSQVHTIGARNACRESIILDVRGGLRKKLTEEKRNGSRPWEVGLEQIADVVLNDPKCQGAKKTVLKLEPIKVGDKGGRIFLEIADALVGLPCLLLNPERQPGTWWRTETDPSGGTEWLWWGSDNFFLRHPALMALVLGLYRQAYSLYVSGFSDRILGSFSRKELERTLDEADSDQALHLLDSIRDWVCVPAPLDRAKTSVPILWYPRKNKQVSFWQRFVRLQRAIRRHGYDEVLGGDFVRSWQLLDKSVDLPTSGVYSFWGDIGNLTEDHKRVMRLGAPERKTRNA